MSLLAMNGLERVANSARKATPIFLGTANLPVFESTSY
jgi:hypothetical protein